MSVAGQIPKISDGLDVAGTMRVDFGVLGRRGGELLAAGEHNQETLDQPIFRQMSGKSTRSRQAS